MASETEALGEVWHVPSLIIRFLALFNPALRAVAEQLYQSERPWVVDHVKFAAAFGAHPTPHPEAIARTLDWYRAA